MDPLILHNQVKAQKVKAMAPYCKHRFVQSMGKYLSLEFHLAVRLAGLCVDNRFEYTDNVKTRIAKNQFSVQKNYVTSQNYLANVT